MSLQTRLTIHPPAHVAEGWMLLSWFFYSLHLCCPLNHPPDLSFSGFIQSPSAHANSRSSQNSAQSPFYVTLIKPVFLPPPRKGWVAILRGAHPVNLSCQIRDTPPPPSSTDWLQSSMTKALARRALWNNHDQNYYGPMASPITVLIWHHL